MREALAAPRRLLLARRATARCACSRASRRSGTRCSRPRARRRRALPARPPGAARAPRRGCSASRRSRRGDWARRNPAPPGGWYFEYRNEFYPDVDDTCMALMVLRAGARRRARGDAGGGDRAAASPGCWGCRTATAAGPLRSRQRQGVADPGPVRRPQRDARPQLRRHHRPRARVPRATSRASTRATRSVARALRFLRRDQSTDGCWYGRWGVNYIYGTWQVLRGLALHRRGPDRAATSAAPCAGCSHHQNARRRLGREHRQLRRSQPGRAWAPRRPARPPGPCWA